MPILSFRIPLRTSLILFALIAVTDTKGQPGAKELAALPTYNVTGTQLAGNEAPIAELVTTIEGEQLQQWSDLSPITALRDLPFFYGNTNNENDSNGGSGSAGVNLFGLGKQSTLTLINGRRAGGSAAFGIEQGGFADLPLISSYAIREIQIARTGTSVAHGSDAIAGTVNILLHDWYDGQKVDATYSDTTDGDASEKSLSFITGQQLSPKTQLVLFGNWYQRNALYARDRAVSADADRRNQGGQNQGSSTFPGRISVDGIQYILRDGISIPSDLSDYRIWDTNEDRYNFSSQAPALPEFERKNLMAQIEHKLSDQVSLWSELMYTQNSFANGLAPAPWSTSGALLTATRNSPHLPTGIAPAELNQVSYRNFELGPLQVDQSKDAWRNLIGLKGEVDLWKWETALMHTKTELNAEFSGFPDANTLIPLITSGAFNPFSRAYSSGIIPSGPLSGQNYSNANALNQAAATGINRYNESVLSYDLKASGPIYESRAGDLNLALGLELRRERIKVENLGFDSPLTVWPAAEYSAQRKVAGLFIESLLPLWDGDSDQQLDLQLGLRAETYKDESASISNHHDALVYNAGLLFRRSEQLRIHFNYASALRAPNLNESMGATQGGYYIYDDSQTPQATRVATAIVSNSDLDPETSQNVNFSISYTPEAITGLNFSVNYYYIQVENPIVNNAQAVVDGTGSGSAYRDAGGALFFVSSKWLNADSKTTDGIEYTLQYSLPHSTGDWQFTLGANQVLRYDVTARPGDASVSYLGQFADPRTASGNAPGSVPRYKGFAQAIWSYENLTLGATLNYIHSLDDDASYTIDSQPREIKAWTSLDLMAQYQWPDSTSNWLQNTTLTCGIENATNESPPFAAGAFADGYDSSLYSAEGRRISLSLSREF